MDDPYQILGVQRTDDAAAIRAAYRSLAKKHHPDLNPGQPEAAEMFKRISAAHDLLSDPEKRARYDRGEIDAEGQEKPQSRPFYRDFTSGEGGAKYYGTPDFDPEDLQDIFARAFAGGMGGARGGAGLNMRGSDARYSLAVSFLDAAGGATRRITLPDGRTLDVTIPPGLNDGQIIRLRGQGNPGLGDGPPGDALIEVAVAPHPHFRREGNDIVLRLPVTLKEAVLGGALEVPTIRGAVRLSIPPNSGDGTRLRLRERGIAGGHQYVELDVVVPPGDEPELAEFLRHWTPRHPSDPRAEGEEA